jgi:hypothetical protein
MFSYNIDSVPINVAASQTLGSGFSNTMELLATYGGYAQAAYACVNFCRIGGKTDWHLPSSSELDLLLSNYYINWSAYRIRKLLLVFIFTRWRYYCLDALLGWSSRNGF